MRTPAVSIIMPVYNQANYVARAIQSVLEQTFQDFEIIVVDDGSTDASAAIVSGIEDDRIRLFSHANNKGQPTARNWALELARAPLVANLDADDIAHRQRIEEQLAFMQRHPELAVSGSWCGFIDSEGKRLMKTIRHLTQPQDIAATMMFKCPLSHRSIMAQTAVMRAYGYQEGFVVRQDAELFGRIAVDFPIANIPRVLVWGRVHNEQISNRKAHLRAQMHTKIFEQQLCRLGLVPDEEDLLRHYYIGRGLPRSESAGAYLSWVHTWLEQLRAANQTLGVFDVSAMQRAIGGAWARTCWQLRAHGSLVSNLLARHQDVGFALTALVNKHLQLRTAQTTS